MGGGSHLVRCYIEFWKDLVWAQKMLYLLIRNLGLENHNKECHSFSIKKKRLGEMQSQPKFQAKRKVNSIYLPCVFVKERLISSFPIKQR